MYIQVTDHTDVENVVVSLEQLWLRGTAVVAQSWDWWFDYLFRLSARGGLGQLHSSQISV